MQSKNEQLVFQKTITERARRLPLEKQQAYLDASQNLSVESIFNKVEKLDAGHKDQSSLRKFDEPLSKVFSVVELLMASISILIQQSPEISSLVIGGVRMVLDVCTHPRQVKMSMFGRKALGSLIV